MACVGNVRHNMSKSITTQQREPDKGHEEVDLTYSVMFGDLTERKIDSTHIWNRMIETMFNLSEPDFVTKPHALKALERLKFLGQENKVRDSLSILCHPRDTLLFIYCIVLSQNSESVCFWKKIDDSETEFPDIYEYVYVSSRKEILPGKYKECDSVRILSNSTFVGYSKEFLSACNRWDIVALKTNKTLDKHDIDNEYKLTYRVIIKKGGHFSIQYVKVIRQEDSCDYECLPEYTTIVTD